MTKLYKVAKAFQTKLVLASNGNLQNLKLVYQAADKLGRVFKSLWMTADKDPYSDFNPEIGKAADKIARLGRNAYYQAINAGMPAEGKFGYAGFLTDMSNAIQNLNNLGPFQNIDPSAMNSLGDLKRALYKAESEFVPVGIPVKNRLVILPEDTITAKPPQFNEGAAYTAEHED